MKYATSLFCMLLSSAIFIHSADPRQSKNPKGMIYDNVIENKSTQPIGVAISLSGGEVNPSYPYDIVVAPGKTSTIHHSAYYEKGTHGFGSSKQFAGVGIAVINLIRFDSTIPEFKILDYKTLPAGILRVQDTTTIEADGQIIATRIYSH